MITFLKLFSGINATSGINTVHRINTASKINTIPGINTIPINNAPHKNHAVLSANLEKDCYIKIKAGDMDERINFAISDFDRSLVNAGGWLEYAFNHY